MCTMHKVLLNMTLSNKQRNEESSSEENDYHATITKECFEEEELIPKDAHCTSESL